MSKVYTGASMSLDGYIAGPGESGFDLLFEWYNNGSVVMPTKMPELTFKLSEVSAEYVRSYLEQTGALVVGRKLFNFTKGWGGEHPLGRPVVVLTHNPPQGWDDNPNFFFVTEGIEAAVDKARQISGDKIVGVNGGVIARQCLNAGLLDEIWVDLVPVLLGGGTPFFDQLSDAPVALDGPLSVVEGDRVTHMRYRVRK